MWHQQKHNETQIAIMWYSDILSATIENVSVSFIIAMDLKDNLDNKQLKKTIRVITL